jgi:hypothetical protein
MSNQSTSGGSQASGQSSQTNPVPCQESLQHAVKFSIAEDRPILLDYWLASHTKEALIGIRESGEKLLVKSKEEYTSPIQKVCKCGQDYLILTENSIYIVASTIPTRKIA